MNRIDPLVLSDTRNAHGCIFDLSVPGDLAYFDGHFPGHPVLPGVVQVHWAIQLGMRSLELSGQFSGFRSLKFHRVIVPGQQVTLSLEVSRQGAQLDFCYASTLGVHSRGRVEFT